MPLDELVTKQRAYFRAGTTRPLSFRQDALKALRRSLLGAETAIYEAVSADMGRPPVETYLMEVNACREEIDFALHHLDEWMEPARVRTPLSMFKATSHIYPEPLGVSLIISAWNYPFLQLFAPLVGSIAAGNTAILKPSDDSPRCAQVCQSIIEQTFDAAFVSTVVGPPALCNELLACKLDKIFFTGSPRVGRHIMAQAAANLVPVTLELGGKSPTIVDDDAAIDVAAKRIVWGKLFNSGQICVAPDHVYVHRAIKDAFVQACIRWIEVFYGKEPMNSPDYGFMINERNFERVVKFLEQGRVLHGGRIDRARRKIEPTLITPLSDAASVMQEEIFGPVLPILEFESLDDVLGRLQLQERPLALYYFSRSKQRQAKVIALSSAGGVTINDVMVHAGTSYLPFGGVGNSGLGVYHGKYSFDAFTHYKSVMTRSDRVDLALRYPPFKGKMKTLKNVNRFL